jgi:hypothetical protein
MQISQKKFNSNDLMLFLKSYPINRKGRKELKKMVIPLRTLRLKRVFGNL